MTVKLKVPDIYKGMTDVWSKRYVDLSGDDHLIISQLYAYIDSSRFGMTKKSFNYANSVIESRLPTEDNRFSDEYIKLTKFFKEYEDLFCDTNKLKRHGEESYIIFREFSKYLEETKSEHKIESNIVLEKSIIESANNVFVRNKSHSDFAKYLTVFNELTIAEIQKYSDSYSASDYYTITYLSIRLKALLSDYEVAILLEGCETL